MSFTLPVTLSSEGITSKLFFFPSEVSNKVKISTQPYITLCVQFLDSENNDKNNTLPLGKNICFTIVWGCAECYPIKC